jgi:hypothetical protein
MPLSPLGKDFYSFDRKVYADRVEHEHVPLDQAPEAVKMDR